MLENLFELVKSHAGEAIINNPAIPNEKNDNAVELASSSIFDTLQSSIANGNLSDVTSLLSGNNTEGSPLAGLMQNNFVQSLMQKYNLDQNGAVSIASGLIPSVLSSLSQKVNDPNDSSFDLQSIISSVSGGNIGTLINQFTNSNNNHQQGNKSLFDRIKSLF